MERAADFFGEERATLFHGSPHVVRRPEFGKGNPNNDYGLGFYSTQLRDLACEWACPRADDGWVNEYVLDTSDLFVLDLSGGDFTILNWIAVLLSHRRVSVGLGITSEARSFIIEQYGVDLSEADIVHGYRADDSYFHIARSFLNNRISVEVLEKALFLGGLGYQVALVSPRAFDNLTWVEAEHTPATLWNPRRIKRDSDARKTAARLEQNAFDVKNGTYVLDLMRKES